MQGVFQRLFRVPGSDEPLTYTGRQADGRWTDGALVGQAGSICAEVKNGAVFFVEGIKAKDQWGSDDEIERYLGRKRDGLIYDNYLSWRVEERRLSQGGKWIESIIGELHGTILEIAVGPGGGVFPFLLRLDPSKTLLVNDVGRWIIEDWKKVSDAEALGASVGFAQFDLRKCPIQSGSVDCIISNQGISNTAYVKGVLSELRRILSPPHPLII